MKQFIVRILALGALIVAFWASPLHAVEKSIVCPADGKFNVRGPVICDPEGKPFLPMGINEFAGTTFSGFNDPFVNANALSKYSDGWKFNILRIVTCPNGRCYHHEGFGGQTVQGEDLDAVIQMYTARKIVVMLDHHGLNFPNVPTQQEIDAAAVWFKQMAIKYKDNPYVWLESFNEPVDGNDKIQTWAGFSGQIIDAIRSVNKDVIIAICAGNFGQDTTGNGDSFDRAGSHIINAGPALAARGNVIFDIHIYSRWGNVSAQGLKNYFKAVHDLGLVVFVGETWANPSSQFGQLDQHATNMLYQARVNGVGILPWSAAGNFPSTTSGRATHINSLTNPTNLTHNGSLHWTFTHNPPSAVPDGYTVTTGTSSPTPPPTDCATRSRGDADCNGQTTLADYSIWRVEFRGGCTATNLTSGACGDNADAAGSIMDADFNADSKVTLADFQIWRSNIR